MERPIIYRDWGIRAIREGRKTHTRRTKGLEEINEHPDEWKYLYRAEDSGLYLFSHPNFGIRAIKCPFGQKGDRLWVREALFRYPYLNEAGYLSTDEPVIDKRNMELSDGIAIWHWQRDILPAIFMPRWASRITQELGADPYPQRVQEISVADIKAEGVDITYSGSEHWRIGSPYSDMAKLWDSIHGKGAWERNPWVWVLPELKVV